MLNKLLSHKLRLLSCFALLIVWLPGTHLRAQPTCACPESQPFGSCVHKTAAYPNQFPGTVAVVNNGATNWLYVADLFNGFTYRYDATLFDRQTPLEFPSPLGSNATTGLTGYTTEGGELFLYWAIENRLYRTDLGGGNRFPAGIVRLEQLTEALRADLGDPGIRMGSLGGITFHTGRRTFWGVDIINDVYFEFDEEGELVLEEGEPRYFFNPERSAPTGGAYGNTITYLVSGGVEYFDIPVGSLTDGRPSAVHRVHASDGVGDESHRIGDDTGIRYSLADLGSPQFVTGIAFWGDSCAEDQHSEFILDLDVVGGAPRILEVSADEPTAANVADFSCTDVTENTVTLGWRKTLPYTQLTITRELLTPPGSTPTTVFEGTDFANDPETITDENVLDGSYRYVAEVTAAQAVAPVDCLTTVGLGSLVRSQRFTGSARTEEPAPFPVTIVNDETVVVVDFDSGDAQTYDLDLNPLGTIRGPFDSGLATGIASVPFDAGGDTPEQRLYWLQNLEGRFFLYVTDLNGDQISSPVPVYGPDSLDASILLGDISYDPAQDAFWTIDILNEVIYAFTPTGETVAAFNAEQLPSPEPGGVLSGGLAVVGSTPTSVVLDIPLGEDDADDLVDQMVRVQYDLSNPAAPGDEIWRLDLVASVGAADIAGVALIETETERFEYVAAMDTSAVYSLDLTSSTSGMVTFRRGDANNDNRINISDPSFLLQYLFRQGTAPTCLAAADSDDDDEVNLTDAIYLFNYLFRSGPQPAPPFTLCGVDLETQLECPQAFCTN